jgi:uncharacterized protein YydD (DUF2326 family)
MIKAIWSDAPGFRKVEFKPDFNVIVAEPTKESTAKDSRNGLGKSSLVEVIHFLLGSSGLNIVKGSPAEDWTFFGLFVFDHKPIVVSRSQRKPSRIGFDSGDISAFEAMGFVFTHEEGSRYLQVGSWVSLLGSMSFDLPLERESYGPSFRSLIAYFIRRGKDAFTSPFSHNRKQATWDIQVNNAYLLELDWRDAKAAQELRDRAHAIQTIQGADLGIVTDYFGKRGELEVERVQLESEIAAITSQLSSFEVAPQYVHLEENADALTSEINDLANRNYSARLILSDYEETLVSEVQQPYLNVEDIYREVGLTFQEGFRRELGDVRRFHAELIANRKAYLKSEIARLGHEIAGRDKRIQDLDLRRATYLRALEVNKALEHYTAMRTELDETKNRLAKVQARLDALSEVEESKAQLKIDIEMARQATLQHYSERRRERDRAVSLFSEASERLYESPGKLLINVGRDSGYTFDYEIERKGSGGYASGAVFCYDMTLAQLWSHRGLSVLVHDSILFDPLDERQTAHSLVFAAERSRIAGFQYICAINTDRIPSRELLKGLSLEDYIVLHLTDSSPAGGLFGVRF